MHHQLNFLETKRRQKNSAEIRKVLSILRKIAGRHVCMWQRPIPQLVRTDHEQLNASVIVMALVAIGPNQHGVEQLKK